MKDWTDIPSGDGIDEAARRYALGMHEPRSFEIYRRIISAMGMSGERALDAGCGTGTYSFALAEHFDRVDGCDLNEARINLARALAKREGLANLHFRVGNVLELPYVDESFDLVFCYGVIVSYIPLLDVLTEFRRVLKPGGTLYLGLNGIGFFYYLRDRRGADSPALAMRARRSIYSTIVRNRVSYTPSHVRQLWSRVDPGDPAMKALKFEVYPGTAEDIIALLGDDDTRLIADTILAECGTDFLDQFVDDLIRIRTGKRDDFSFPTAGRGYDPEFVGATVAQAGFTNYRWDDESRLFDLPPEINVNTWGRVRIIRYHGHLARWEMTAEKP